MHPILRLSSRVAFALAVTSSAATAQSLASRIASVGDGAVTFHFAARPGVCGDGAEYIRLGRTSFMRNSSMADTSDCEPGPVQVRVTMRDGTAQRVETWVGPLRNRSARDLGLVGATEAATWLLDAAAHGHGRGEDDAIVPAVLADSTVTWPTLLRMARATAANGGRHGGNAAFWLSRFASGAVNGHGANSLDDADRPATKSDEEDVKTHAVFVMSQLPHDEAVPGLLRIAKTNRDPQVRASAIFWLGQSGDARALDYFETVLRAAR